MRLTRGGLRGGLRLTVAGAAAVLLAGCGTGLGSLPLPARQVSAQTITLTAIFSNALNLPTKARVKLNGADIGEVSAIHVHDFNAYVDMRVDSDVHLFKGASAQLRSATPLGDIFVGISPDPNQSPDAAPLHDGDVIPLGSTRAAATIEEVLSSAALLVNGGSVRQLVTIFNGAGEAAGGQGANIATLLHQSSDILSRLNTRTDQIQTALQRTSALSATLSGRQATTIDAAIQAAAPATSVIADDASRLADLAETVGHISNQFSKFPSVQGTDTRSLIADLNHVDDAFTQVAVDPDITLAAVNPLFPVFVKMGAATAVPADGTIVKLALGNHPDKNFPGDPAFHGPDGTDYHLMVGGLRYEWNLLLDKIYGPNR